MIQQIDVAQQKKGQRELEQQQEQKEKWGNKYKKLTKSI